MFLGGSKKGKTIFLCSVDLVVQGNNFLAPKEGGSDLVLYRFSAFWLRSKYDLISKSRLGNTMWWFSISHCVRGF